ncbi:CLUMA_CG016966, isoform A [Clunio marinus]|uniref:CLUMA_CG016966, isoform A n=1 Tax=Clunio marinus TaxID=568069 RepID=A0A1J1ISS6_9DIPT|nr:CLUMA_CG016966, isoform A [Clunio marinus]
MMTSIMCEELESPSGKAVRQYFPYVSSESDLQRYKAITLHKHPSNETRASSSLSNVPSDSAKTKDNGSAKYFQGTRTGRTGHVGEKVAQLKQNEICKLDNN